VHTDRFHHARWLHTSHVQLDRERRRTVPSYVPAEHLVTNGHASSIEL
jgi:hypothetical protein